MAKKKTPFSELHLFALASSIYVEITRLSDKSQSRPFAMHKLYRKKGIFFICLVAIVEGVVWRICQDFQAESLSEAQPSINCRQVDFLVEIAKKLKFNNCS